MGLHRAGLQVTGVDIKPQPHYPFHFIQADALDVLRWKQWADEFDFIWASPPCQAYTLAGMNRRRDGHNYPNLVAPTRNALISKGVPWVIENVPGAPVRPDFILCGSQFGLPIARHRHFECSFANGLTSPCAHDENVITVCGHGIPQWMRRARIKKGLHPNASVAMKKQAMGIDWMNREELSQAIPPAYAQYIAEQFLKTISTSEANCG